MKILLAICVLVGLLFASDIQVLKKDTKNVGSQKKSREYMKVLNSNFSEKVQRKDEKQIEVVNNENS